jgi:hypothetical protein
MAEQYHADIAIAAGLLEKVMLDEESTMFDLVAALVLLSQAMIRGDLDEQKEMLERGWV